MQAAVATRNPNRENSGLRNLHRRNIIRLKQRRAIGNFSHFQLPYVIMRISIYEDVSIDEAGKITDHGPPAGRIQGTSLTDGTRRDRHAAAMQHKAAAPALHRGKTVVQIA